MYAWLLPNKQISEDCEVLDDVVFCTHDIVEAMNGGRCVLAGFTYICQEDARVILQNKCIEFFYESIDGVKPKEICGRELVNFFHGKPVAIDGLYSNKLTIVTGNDIPILNERCLTVQGFHVCWESVAKPYEFIDK